MSREEFLREVREAVRGELLLHGPRSEGPLILPHDTDAERELLHLMLNGKATFESLSPLRASDFFVPLHMHICVAVDMVNHAGIPRRSSRVVMALEKLGVTGIDLAGELSSLACYPATGEATMVLVARVVEAAKARKLIAKMSDVDIGLRLGKMTVTDALDTLKRLR